MATAILYVVESNASTAEVRGAAMHHRSAKHSFLFSRQGTLLHASHAALAAYEQGSGTLTVWHTHTHTLLTSCTVPPLGSD